MKNLPKKAYLQLCQLVTSGFDIRIGTGYAKEFEVTVFKGPLALDHYEGDELHTAIDRAFVSTLKK
jgi:hypothetical protein